MATWTHCYRYGTHVITGEKGRRQVVLTNCNAKYITNGAEESLTSCRRRDEEVTPLPADMLRGENPPRPACGRRRNKRYDSSSLLAVTLQLTVYTRAVQGC